MMIMGKEDPRRSRSIKESPRTRLPQIVGESRAVEEGDYVQDSPLAQRGGPDPDGAYEDDFDDGGEQDLRLDSRADGRAWEDGADAPEEKDPLAQGFRELRVLSQIARKKAGAASKDFESDMNALEVKMKRLHLHASGEYTALQRQLKAQKKSNLALQQALKSSKNTVNQTVTQAFEDVTLLTQKLKSVEENFSQVRVDKEHIEKGFRSELAAVQAKNNSLQKNLLSCKLELEELAHKTKAADEKIRQVTFDKLEAQKEANTLRNQLSVFEDDFTAVKQREAKAVKDLQQLRDELDAERSNLRDEQESFNKQREMANSELVRLQVDRDNALKDSRRVEEYKEMNLELKKALAQAQVLLDEAETVRNNGTKALLETHKEEMEAMERKHTNRIEGLQEQVRLQQSELKALETKAAFDAAQARAQFDSLSSKSEEAVKTLTEANKLLSQEQQMLTAQTRELQQQLQVKVKELSDVTLHDSGSQETHEQQVADLRAKILELQAGGSEVRQLARDQQVHLQQSEHVITQLESLLTNLIVALEEPLPAATHGPTLSRGHSSRSRRSDLSSAGQAGGEVGDEWSEVRGLEDRIAQLLKDVAQERELRAQAETQRAALEAKIKKVRTERDATSKLAKNFMLQLSRSNVRVTD